MNSNLIRETQEWNKISTFFFFLFLVFNCLTFQLLNTCKALAGGAL